MFCSQYQERIDVCLLKLSGHLIKINKYHPNCLTWQRSSIKTFYAYFTSKNLLLYSYNMLRMSDYHVSQPRCRLNFLPRTITRRISEAEIYRYGFINADAQVLISKESVKVLFAV